MLTLGDFDMNSTPRDSSSLKDVFRQTMLNQEMIFRNQVHELHRLYSVQKTLMKDLKPVVLEKHNPWKANPHSFSRETRLATKSIPMLDSRASTSRGLFEGWQGNNYKFQPRPFGQSLPNQHISLEGNDIPNKVKVRDNLNEAMDVNSLRGRNSSDPLELRLSLSLGVVNGKTEDKERNKYDKKTSSCSRIVIDLEESTERTSDEDTKHLPFGGKLASQVTINSDGLKCKENMPDENFLTKKFTSSGMGCMVDLNEVQLDDSSCDDCVVVHPLINSDNGITEVECEPSSISPASESRLEIDLSKDPGDEPTLNPACVVDTQLGFEKTEEEDNALLCSDKIGITIEDEHPDPFPSSGKSSCISGNDSSPVRTMESETQPFSSSVPVSDQFSGTQGISKVAETSSGEQDRRSSDSNETKDECYDNKEDSPEVNDLIQIAAESLILISSMNPVPYQESSTLTESNEQSQCSYDSYELMTLELEDSVIDDHSVSSKMFEVSDGATNGFAVKLRRGRRMKDFQKEILPSLASLSRHEIREDVNVFEGVLRSREYKKMRAMMSNEEGWCKPVRSKRSRRSYGGRKI